MTRERVRGNTTDAKKPVNRELVGLPYRPFLFTLDQVAQMLSLTVERLSQVYVYFEGRSTGNISHDLMVARNIAPPNLRPEYRITERELLRWMKRKGFHHYDSTVATY